MKQQEIWEKIKQMNDNKKEKLKNKEEIKKEDESLSMKFKKLTNEGNATFLFS